MPPTGPYNEVIDRADLETAGHPFHISFMAALIRCLADSVERQPSQLSLSLWGACLKRRRRRRRRKKKWSQSRGSSSTTKSSASSIRKQRAKGLRASDRGRERTNNNTFLLLGGRGILGNRDSAGKSAGRRIEVESVDRPALRGRIALIGRLRNEDGAKKRGQGTRAQAR